MRRKGYMKSFLPIVLVIQAFMVNVACANLFDEWVGKWRVETTYFKNGREVSKELSQDQTRKLRGGVLYTLNTSRANGRRITNYKEWLLPGGKSLWVSYQNNGRVELLGEGTWRVSGNVYSWRYRSQSLKGPVTYSGTYKRVNRDRGTEEAIYRDREGTWIEKSVYTRIR